MATIKPRPGGSGDVLRQPRGVAPTAKPPQTAPESYQWEHTVVPSVRALSRHDMAQTTLALCGVLGLFAATSLLLIVLSVVQLSGTERVESAVLCLVIATLLVALIGYVVLTPLDPQRTPARRRR